MDVRYEGGGLEPDLEVVDYISLQKVILVLKWVNYLLYCNGILMIHRMILKEIVTKLYILGREIEIPFIDRPEFVDYIYSEDSEINTVSIREYYNRSD